MAKLVFDENDLTIGDLEDFEEATGLELQDALKPVVLKDDDGNTVRHNCADEDDHEPCADNGRPVQTVKITPKILKTLVWIANRHDDPGFTLEDARKVKVTELDIVRAEDDDAPKGDDPKD